MTPDLVVVGGGVFGLSVAVAARRLGLSVRVLEAHRTGAGASGAALGALAPHAPSRWSPMTAFQFAGLMSLAARIADLEAATGRATGYARTGRLAPLPDAAARARAEREVGAAPAAWGKAATLRLLDAPPPEGAGWIAPEAAAAGVLADTASATIEPVRYLAALAAALGDAVEEGAEALRIDPAGAVETAAGRVAAGHVVVAAGIETWGLVAPLAPGLGTGTAVKGQAARLGMPCAGRPLVQAPGLLIVPQGVDGVAVGATTEHDWSGAGDTDARLDALIDRARALSPALATAPVVARWAGLRPRPPGRTPVAGHLPDHPRVLVAGGGYKIGLGIAHLVGDALAAMIAGTEPDSALPAAFLPASVMASGAAAR